MPFVKLFIVIINLPRLLLHLLVFAFYFDRCKDDVKVNISSAGLKWGG